MRLVVETGISEKEAVKLRKAIADDLEEMGANYHIHLSFDICNGKRGIGNAGKGQFGRKSRKGECNKIHQ